MRALLSRPIQILVCFGIFPSTGAYCDAGCRIGRKSSVARKPSGKRHSWLDRQHDLGVVEVWSAQLETLASATHPEIAIVALEAPDSELIRKGLSGVESTVIEEAGAGELIRGVVPIYSTFQREDVVGVVVVNRFIPRAMGQRIDLIRDAVASYRRLQPSEGTFQTSMLLLLGMLTLASLLFSSWMGFRLAKQITEPIQRLCEAADQVAAGNLDVRVEQRGDDEIEIGRAHV